MRHEEAARYGVNAMSAASSPLFQPGDKVTVRSGKTVWTALETYRDGADTCLVLASDHDRCVEYARDCKAARAAA